MTGEASPPTPPRRDRDAEAERCLQIARDWFEGWRTFDLSLLGLAPDFVHTSPLGRFEGRETYLAAVEPMARKSSADILVHDMVVEGNVVVARYENVTPRGNVEAMDWIRIEGDVIQEINAVYDSVKVREVLGGNAGES
jgi:hypothetical protein